MNNRFIKKICVIKKLGESAIRVKNNTNMNLKNIPPGRSLTRNLTVFFTVLSNEITFSVIGYGKSSLVI